MFNGIFSADSRCERSLQLCERKLGNCQTENLALADQVSVLCETNDKLAQNNEQLVSDLMICKGDRDKYRKLYQECQQGGNSEDLQELKDIIALMEDGPGAPKDPLRVITLAQMVQLLDKTLGDHFRNCPGRMFSDADWLVATREDIQIYLDYYSMFWLPKIKPYTVVEWKKLDGSTVKVWQRDCDDFSDFFQGFPALHVDWTGLPWGTMWAQVEGWIQGSHAFNFTVARNGDYKEQGIDGLYLYLIEPQGKNAMWVPTRDGDEIKVAEVDRLVMQPAATFKISQLNNIKV